MCARALSFTPPPTRHHSRALPDLLQELMLYDREWVEGVRLMAEWRLIEVRRDPAKATLHHPKDPQR